MEILVFWVLILKFPPLSKFRKKEENIETFISLNSIIRILMKMKRRRLWIYILTNYSFKLNYGEEWWRKTVSL